MLKINGLSAGYKNNHVLNDISLSADSGEITTVIGKNGSGKSTLLRAILGALPKIEGEISFDGEDLRVLSPIELSRRVSYLAQDKNIPDITVSRLVLSGRFPHLSYPRRYRKKDIDIAESAMKKMGIYGLRDIKLSALSGGMRQKAYIAMALCQQTDVILMDEPTTYLDITQQFLLADTVRDLANDNKAVILVLHDLLFALRISDRIVLIDNGGIGFVGSPCEFVSSGIPEAVYGVHIRSEENEYYYERI